MTDHDHENHQPRDEAGHAPADADAARTPSPSPSPRHRDRDDHGRPQQARPRDELGRPLPYGTKGVEPVSDEPLPPLQTVTFARDLLDQGRPFSAHEVFEARWKRAPASERDLWQGLAQLCVGVTHALRGNATGAARLVERGEGRLRVYGETGGPTYGVDLPAAISWAKGHVTGAVDDEFTAGPCAEAAIRPPTRSRNSSAQVSVTTTD